MRFDQQVNLCHKDTSATLATRLLKKPVHVKIPSFRIYEHKMSKCFALSVEKASFNLKKMAERTKKDQVIFSTLAESLVDGEITVDEEGWPKKEDAMTLMALIVRGINIIAIIYKGRIIDVHNDFHVLVPKDYSMLNLSPLLHLHGLIYRK